ncbi:hypothetical protein QBC39DRAFT_357586 [Podospora conica]|nr:hypothetical protein QBC39DRAFT_357586 [Schizothecium conicum]
MDRVAFWGFSRPHRQRQASMQTRAPPSQPPDDHSPPPQRRPTEHRRMAWHVCEGPPRVGRKRAEASGIARAKRPMARRPAHPGPSLRFRCSPDSQRFFHEFSRFCRCCCTARTARRWREKGGDDIQDQCGWRWSPGFPSLVSHLPSPTVTGLPPVTSDHCPLPTAHSPAPCPLFLSPIPQNHSLTQTLTHTHTPIRPSPSSLATFPLSPPSTPPRKPAALHSQPLQHCSLGPCPGNSALHHHQPGP